MIDRLVPAAVVTVATTADLLETPLFAAEERALGRAVDARRREFVTGRACAREALGRLGVGSTPIGSGARGEPLWPAGVVGSITHCAGYRASAVARARDIRWIGIDAEPHAPLPAGVLDTIAGADERRALPAAGAQDVAWDRVLFSAKEAVFKAWYPLTRRSLGFDEVDVRIDGGDATFHASVTPAGAAATEMRGRWGVCGAIVATAVVAAW